MKSKLCIGFVLLVGLAELETAEGALVTQAVCRVAPMLSPADELPLPWTTVEWVFDNTSDRLGVASDIPVYSPNHRILPAPLPIFGFLFVLLMGFSLPSPDSWWHNWWRNWDSQAATDTTSAVRDGGYAATTPPKSTYEQEVRPAEQRTFQVVDVSPISRDVVGIRPCLAADTNVQHGSPDLAGESSIDQA